MNTFVHEQLGPLLFMNTFVHEQLGPELFMNTFVHEHIVHEHICSWTLCSWTHLFMNTKVWICSWTLLFMNTLFMNTFVHEQLGPVLFMNTFVHEHSWTTCSWTCSWTPFMNINPCLQDQLRYLPQVSSLRHRSQVPATGREGIVQVSGYTFLDSLWLILPSAPVRRRRHVEAHPSEVTFRYEEAYVFLM